MLSKEKRNYDFNRYGATRYGNRPAKEYGKKIIVGDKKLENISDTLHAYKIAKRCNEKRVMAESAKCPGKDNCSECF